MYFCFDVLLTEVHDVSLRTRTCLELDVSLRESMHTSVNRENSKTGAHKACEVLPLTGADLGGACKGYATPSLR